METNLKAIDLKDLRRRHTGAGRMASGLPSPVEEADLISYEGSIINELRSLDRVPRSVRTQAREIEKANAKLTHPPHRDQVSPLDTIQDASAVDPAPSTSPISRRVRFSW